VRKKPFLILRKHACIARQCPLKQISLIDTHLELGNEVVKERDVNCASEVFFCRVCVHVCPESLPSSGARFFQGYAEFPSKFRGPHVNFRKLLFGFVSHIDEFAPQTVRMSRCSNKVKLYLLQNSTEYQT